LLAPASDDLTTNRDLAGAEAKGLPLVIFAVTLLHNKRTRFVFNVQGWRLIIDVRFLYTDKCIYMQNLGRWASFIADAGGACLLGLQLDAYRVPDPRRAT